MQTKKGLCIFVLSMLLIGFFLTGLTGLTFAAPPQTSLLEQSPGSTGILQKTPHKLVTEAVDGTQDLAAPPDPLPTKTDQAIQAAFHQTVEDNRAQILGLLLNQPFIESIHYSADGTTALIWMALRDPQTGSVIASEPGLAIARSANVSAPEEAASWQIILQSTEPFQTQLENLPADLLTDEIRMRYLSSPAEPDPSAVTQSAVLHGYKLPWAAGVGRRVTNSIGHYLSVSGGLTSCPGTCKYAFDFADGTMFPLLAAKGGTVKAFKWTCPNNANACTNYLILEDQSTSPVSYQVYYHMAYDTLAARLRTVGAAVNQGEYIGNVDNTGYSTGHHLHFHVYNIATQADWSWGYAVDFTFDDVSDNGGRPRTCAEAIAYPGLGNECQKDNRYVSGNVPAHPPAATISGPADQSMLTSSRATVSGTATDDISITRIEVMAFYNQVWNHVDDIPPVTGAFSKEVDLCAANVPDGPLSLTVRVYDYEGGQSFAQNVQHVIKNYACNTVPPPPPVPACVPGDDQVALYAGRDFRGSCQKFSVSDSGYSLSSADAVGDNNAASIQVGKNVRAILFDRGSDLSAAHTQGRIETLESSDASLADNRIGIDSVSGLRVRSRDTPADEPFFNRSMGIRSTAGTNPTSFDSLVLAWEGGEGATSFDIAIAGPTPINKTVTGNSLSLGSLPAGNYSGVVTAKNAAGPNSSFYAFDVAPASALPAVAVRSLPFEDYLENGPGDWIASGLWHYSAVSLANWPTTHAWVYNKTSGYSPDYSTDTYQAGDLTSPPMLVPANGTHYLRFAYFADLEDGNRDWDQRWVQVSAGGGPFTNLYQMAEDKLESHSWLNSGPISLASYRGKTIRLRFHFDTVDEDRNSSTGWVVDDITVNTLAPETSCADDGSIPVLSLGQTVYGVICPEGDQDLYKISGQYGQAIAIDLDAKSLNPSSSLDTVVSLLDSDQRSVIDWNDDEIKGQQQDSLLNYTFSHTGTYYVKVSAWDYPGAGGNTHFYNLTLRPQVFELKPPQSVSVLYPLSPALVPQMPFEISVAAQDYDGGPVAQVEFYWHGPNWNDDNWVKLPTDKTYQDGWTVILDPLAYGGGLSGSALYVQAISRTGGLKGVVWWNLQTDGSPPISTMTALPSVINSTVFPIYWSGADAGSGVDHFDLQFQVNGGAWANRPGSPFSSSVRSTLVQGELGNAYGFRVRAVDKLGNEEAFSNAAQAFTQLSSTCADSNEIPGQTSANAMVLSPNVPSPQLNLCQTNDEDWFAIQAIAGKPLVIFAFSQGGQAAFSLTLYNSQNQVQVVSRSPGFGTSAAIGNFTPNTNVPYYLKVMPRDGQPYGMDVRYQVLYAPASLLFLPTIGR